MDSRLESDDHIAAKVGRYLSSRWQAIAIGGLIGFLAGILYLQFGPKYYTASIVIGPTSAVPAQAGLGNLSSLSLSSLGGLGAKISSFVGGDSSSAVAPFDAFQQTLTSNILARRLLTHPELMHRLFPESWNAQSCRWEEPSGVAPMIKDIARGILNSPAWHPPDADSIEDYLNKNLAKVPQPGSSLIQLSFQSEDPSVARDFLKSVYQDLDAIVRNIDLDRSSEIIKSINNELKNSGPLSANATDAVIQFLDQQYQVVAFARANVAYSAGVFDDLAVSARPTSPLPGPTLLFGVLLGTCGGLIFTHLARRQNSHRVQRHPATIKPAQSSL